MSMGMPGAPGAPMDPMSALQVLANYTEQLTLTRTEHHMIEQALGTIAQTLQPPPPPSSGAGGAGGTIEDGAGDNAAALTEAPGTTPET